MSVFSWDVDETEYVQERCKYGDHRVECRVFTDNLDAVILCCFEDEPRAVAEIKIIDAAFLRGEIVSDTSDY